MVEEVERTGRIHPWTIVDQGGGKWRACHDYSHLTNTLVQTSPFSLPSIWDARKDITPMRRAGGHPRVRFRQRFPSRR